MIRHYQPGQPPSMEKAATTTMPGPRDPDEQVQRVVRQTAVWWADGGLSGWATTAAPGALPHLSLDLVREWMEEHEERDLTISGLANFNMP
ncbi:hypothetical protein TRIUR3_24854 [Triticum urartu]|uniref:Uncharacterized protein n=1 Tax=Triticum urartu TaxID=4572 RepID=M7ZTH4_TRIUA|nr:hypothetical protein TRIUR3_24854 [Triticum urartu]